MSPSKLSPAHWDDALNPVMVKELRQAVRSRFVAALLLLFLFVQLVIVALMLNDAQGVAIRPLLGRQLFTILNGAILFTCVVGLGVYTAARMFAERSGESLDLLYVTALSPRSIVAGKLAASMVLALLLYGASLPFVTFTYLLRGIALSDIFLLLGLGLLIVLDGVAFCLAVAALGGGRLVRILVGLVGLAALFMGYFSVQIFLILLFEDASMRSDLTEALMALTACGLVFAGWMYVVAVALLSPPSAERARWPRLFGTVALVLTALLIWLGGGSTDWWEVWLLSWSVVIAVAFVVASSGPEEPSPRVARKIPRAAVLRLGAFPFTSGAAGGFLWAVGGIAALMAIGGLSGVRGETVLQAASLALYAMAYSLTAVFLRRLFLRRRLTADKTWVVVLLLLALGGAVLPILGLALLAGAGGDTGLWLLTSPMAAGHNALEMTAPLFAGLWALVALLVNLPWLSRQWRFFRPLPPPPEVTDG
jgi:hypothetical protein